MNNLLKIFLIFNLIPSLTSSVNNFSVPLPETELTMGQNSSEIVKREEVFFLSGGLSVIGYSPTSKGGLPLCEVPCTISFPVQFRDNKGFLISYDCATTSVFVDDILIGKVSNFYNFKPELGLEYAFVSVYDEYWTDLTSKSVLHSDCEGNSVVMPLVSIPVLPIPNQPPLNFEVCAFGGESGFVCGEIVDFGVTITVNVPKTCGDKTTQLFDVTKVLMNKVYSEGDLGAPVYIPLSVPNSKQTIASPVGQVVGDRSGTGQKSRFWYYIPLDRILADSGGLKIASGDLSYLLPPNNTDSGSVSVSDDLTKESNVSDINNLVRRQPPQPQAVDVHAGKRMWIFKSNHGEAPIDGNNAKKCTFGFAVRKVRGRNRFDHGFLTLSGCMHGTIMGFPYNGNPAYYTPNQNWVQQEAIQLGAIGSLVHEPANGISYTILRLLPNNEQYTLWDDQVSADMIVDNAGELEFVAVSRQPQPQTWLYENQELCWWGSSSGHMCGTVVDTSATRVKANPWRWNIYVDAVLRLTIEGVQIPYYLRFDPKDYFQSLIKVRVDENYRPHAEEGHHQSDSGAPVYLPSHNRLGLITAARPVGILFDYVLKFENINDMCVPVWYMYCLSVDRILINSRITADDLEIIGENI